MLQRIAEATAVPTAFFVTEAREQFALNGSSDIVADLMVEIGTRLMAFGQAEREKSGDPVA